LQPLWSLNNTCAQYRTTVLTGESASLTNSAVLA
jgi:hypothetical protein